MNREQYDRAVAELKARAAKQSEPPTPGMVFRDALERIEALERRKRDEARARRAAAVAVAPQATVALMADDANCKVRRLRVVDPVERAFRDEQIDENAYRLARCLEADLNALTPRSGGLRLERLHDCGHSRREDGVYFVLMPSGPRSVAAPQGARDDALDRLRMVAEALPSGPCYPVLCAWAGEAQSLYRLDARWRRRRGWALRMVQFGLSIMSEAKLYERAKWRVSVLAEARP
jgi:hypothetical protein